ncbi:hypothetical protein [Vibrio lentus]|uniref:PD-(D/E)XK nuclease domain-containing protein n=1 Tax=Vibrio lentus TaxID=136468 RepID=UPI000C82F7F3|nr:hypothetical protein [Vibrio lentus]PMH03977.1 hypothetical protein BCU78_02475 [Vibrio lentus]
MSISTENLIKSIKEKSTETWGTTYELFFQKQDLMDPDYGELPEDMFGDPFLRARLSFELDKLYTSILLALELLKLPIMLDRLKEQYEPVRRKMDQEDFLLQVSEPSCPALEILEEYSSALESLAGLEKLELENKPINGQDTLFQVLEGTPVIVRDAELDPSNEAQIQKRVYDILKHVFPDTVREYPITKTIKRYKPDICIRSLKSAVEYKFCDSAEEMKVCVDGIIEDVGAYSNTDDWKFFYGVIYMTGAFWTQAQVEAHLRECGVNENWKILLVTGKGARKKNS